MLTLLATVKARLAIASLDTQYDALLANAIEAVSARFDLECRRTLARTADAVYEFDAGDTEILVPCYPIETVARFETKFSEAEGWVEQPDIEYLIRRGCIVSLASPINCQLSTINCPLARVVYTGGHVLPGAVAEAGQTPLPVEIEQAAVEQVAFWYQNRDRLGVMRQWPKGGTYEQFADLDLLPNVRAVLDRYRRVGL